MSEPKIPPNSKESEMMVLGCMLTSINSLNIAADALDETDFYYSEHKIIFLSLKSAYRNDKPADVHLIAEDLKRQEKLQTVGGVAYLTSVAQYAGTSAYVEEYVDVVKNKSLLRRIIYAAQTTERKALEGLTDSSTILYDAQDEFQQIEKFRTPYNKFPIRFMDQFDENPLFAEPPKKPMLLECVNDNNAPIGFLPKGIVGMLVGQGGVGKSHLLSQLAISITTGTPFLGTFTTTYHCGQGKKGNVFLGMGENDYSDIARLLYKASRELRSKDDGLLTEASKRIAAFSFCGQNAAFIEDAKPTRYFRDLKKRLHDTAPTDGWSLIILDPVSRLLGADAETDNAAATQFVALLEELTIDLPGNPTVLFAHHMNKASQKQNVAEQTQSGARGSSAITDGARWQVMLSKEKEGEKPEQAAIVLKMTKSNHTAYTRPIRLQKDSEGFIFRHDDQEFGQERTEPNQNGNVRSAPKRPSTTGNKTFGIYAAHDNS